MQLTGELLCCVPASRALGRQLDEQASLDMLNHLNGLVLPEDLFFIEALILSLLDTCTQVRPPVAVPLAWAHTCGVFLNPRTPVFRVAHLTSLPFSEPS